MSTSVLFPTELFPDFVENPQEGQRDTLYSDQYFEQLLQQQLMAQSLSPDPVQQQLSEQGDPHPQHPSFEEIFLDEDDSTTESSLIDLSTFSTEGLITICKQKDPASLYLEELQRRVLEDRGNQGLMIEFMQICEQLNRALATSTSISDTLRCVDENIRQEEGICLRKIIIMTLSGVDEPIALAVATGLYKNHLRGYIC